jgi:hypothetical protein
MDRHIVPTARKVRDACDAHLPNLVSVRNAEEDARPTRGDDQPDGGPREARDTLRE